MLKAFRKRFIILNISLAGIVLLAAYAVIGTMICQNEYSDLKNTMAAVLKPWNTGSRNDQSGGTAPENNNPPERKDKPSQKPEPKKPDEKDNISSGPAGGEKHEREHNNNISTIFYDTAEKKLSVLDEIVFDDDAEEVVDSILTQHENFGTIKQYSIIYYYEKTGSMVKIAVCSEDYITFKLFERIMVLALTFLLAMVLMLIISIRLAGFAEKPLRHSIEMERKFVADVSHDLKTPITVIMANNSIIKSNRSLTVSDNMQWIESTDKASEDMMQLVSNMLTMSSVDGLSPQKVDIVPVSLSSAAERCILQFESVAYEKNVMLEYEIEKDLTVYGTDEYIKRICGGLIGNAVKYEPEKGRIVIKSYSRKNKVFFMVQNICSRISKEDMPHIFDRFYRGDSTRTLSKGNGLGLSIIKQMVTLCGADIKAVSNDKEGTVFTVIFRKA